MAKQKELFEYTLESFRRQARELYPGKLVFKLSQAAQIVGVSDTTLWRKGVRGDVTVEQLAWLYS